MRKVFKSSILLSLLVVGSLSTLTACSTPSNQIPATENPALVGGYTRPINFNYLVDTDITKSDSRIKSIELVAGQNPSATIILKFSDKAGKIYTQKLVNIFKTDGFKNVTAIGYKSNVPYTVSVYLNFSPLDKVVKPTVFTESMNSVMKNLNTGSAVNDSITIKDN